MLRVKFCLRIAFLCAGLLKSTLLSIVIAERLRTCRVSLVSRASAPGVSARREAPRLPLEHSEHRPCKEHRSRSSSLAPLPSAYVTEGGTKFSGFTEMVFVRSLWVEEDGVVLSWQLMEPVAWYLLHSLISKPIGQSLLKILMHAVTFNYFINFLGNAFILVKLSG